MGLRRICEGTEQIRQKVRGKGGCCLCLFFECARQEAVSGVSAISDTTLFRVRPAGRLNSAHFILLLGEISTIRFKKVTFEMPKLFYIHSVAYFPISLSHLAPPRSVLPAIVQAHAASPAVRRYSPYSEAFLPFPAAFRRTGPRHCRQR